MFRLRETLLGSVSAAVLSIGCAVAQDQPDAEAQTLVEAGGTAGVAFTEDNAGTAAQALVGMQVASLEGMEVFDDSGEMIGRVAMVAQGENGEPYVILEADENARYVMPGRHAVPVPAFDFSEEANGLILRADYTTMPGAGTTMGAGAGTAGWSRLYTVMDSEQTIENVNLDGYMVMAPAEQDPATDAYAELVEYGGDARQVLEQEGIVDIEGRDVYGADHEEIGDVEEVAHDDQNNLFLIVELNDGVLGIGQSERAVQLDAFNYSVEDEAFIFTEGGQEDLEALPEWDPGSSQFTVIETDLDWAAYRQSETTEADASAQAEVSTDEEATIDADASAEAVAPTDEATETAESVEPAAGTADDAMNETADAAETAADAVQDTAEAVEDSAAEIAEGAGDAMQEALGNARQALSEQGITDLEGYDILNASKEDIGTVEAVAVDAQANLHLILSLDDGVLGIGDSERAVDIGAFDYSAEDEALILRDTSESALEAMPEWDSDDPNLAVIDEEIDWSQFK